MDEMEFLCFTALEDTEISWVINGTLDVVPQLSYNIDSTEEESWTNYEFGDSISLSAGQKCYWQGTTNTFSKDFDNYIHFVSTGLVDGSGPVDSLINWESLTSFCYTSMFTETSSLVHPPVLPSTTLADRCYLAMFINCNTLVEAPELPATELTEACYSFMFSNCYRLTRPPQLPATSLASGCYGMMFFGCLSIRLSEQENYIYNIPYRIPAEGIGVGEEDSTSFMFTNTGGTFVGAPDINKTYYLSVWDNFPYMPDLIDNNIPILTFIDTINTNFDNYKKTSTPTQDTTLNILSGYISGFGDSLSNLIKTANAEDVVVPFGNTRQFVTNTQIASWDTLTTNGIKIVSIDEQTIMQSTLVVANTHFSSNKVKISFSELNGEGEEVSTVVTKFLPKINYQMGHYMFTFAGNAWTVTYNDVTQLADLQEYGIQLLLNDRRLIDGDYFTVDYTANEDIKQAFASSLGITRQASKFENDGDGTEGSFYAQSRNMFTIHETVSLTIPITSISKSVLDNNYPYTGIIDLNQFKYTIDSEDKNNCIYQQELDNIEDYTVIMAFGQDIAAGDNITVSKLVSTKNVDGKAMVEIYLSMPPGYSQPINVKSLLFFKDTPHILPERYITGTYLTSDGEQWVDSEITQSPSTPFAAEFVFKINDFETSDDTGIIVGNENIGVGYQKDNNGKWHWAVKGENWIVSDEEIVTSQLYYVRVKIGQTNTTLTTNNAVIFDNVSNPLSSSTTPESLYIFGAGEDTNLSSINLLALKIYGIDYSITEEPSGVLNPLLGDYSMCWDADEDRSCLYDYVQKQPLYCGNEDADLEFVTEEDLSDFIVSGQGAPNQYTTGVIGQFYKDNMTGKYYLCTDIVAGTTYIWSPTMLGYYYTDIDEEENYIAITYTSEYGTAPSDKTVRAPYYLSSSDLPTLTDSSEEYRFDGWFNEDYTIQYEPGLELTQDLHLFAKWSSTSQLTVKVLGSGNTNYCYATINGTKVTSQGNFTVNPGDTITFTVYGRSSTYMGKVKVNGTDVKVVTNNATSTYSYVVNNNLEIFLAYFDTYNYRNGKIFVQTVTGHGDVVSKFVEDASHTYVTIWYAIDSDGKIASDGTGKNNGKCANVRSQYNTVPDLSTGQHTFSIKSTWDGDTTGLTTSITYTVN